MLILWTTPRRTDDVCFCCIRQLLQQQQQQLLLLLQGDIPTTTTTILPLSHPPRGSATRAARRSVWNLQFYGQLILGSVASMRTDGRTDGGRSCWTITRSALTSAQLAADRRANAQYIQLYSRQRPDRQTGRETLRERERERERETYA